MAEDCELLYFADPMCSWCWGFAPSVARLAARFEGIAPLTVVVGGLKTCTERTLEEEAKAMIRHHWERVRAATGQPFDHAFFERPRFVYDTEPSCRAVVAARHLAPASALPMLEALHRAFYAENRDVTDVEVLSEIGAALLGVSAARFREVYDAEETESETYADFALAREIGVGSFPTVLARCGEELRVVTQGWQPLTRIEPQLEAWLAQTRRP